MSCAIIEVSLAARHQTGYETKYVAEKTPHIANATQSLRKLVEHGNNAAIGECNAANRNHDTPNLNALDKSKIRGFCYSHLFAEGY